MKNNKYLIIRLKENDKNKTANRYGKRLPLSPSSSLNNISETTPLCLKGLPYGITIKEVVHLSYQQEGLVSFRYSTKKEPSDYAENLVNEVLGVKNGESSALP